MKGLCLLVALFAQLVAGAAFAVPVEFNTLTETVSVSVPDSLTLNGVTFTYDNTGSLDPTLDFAIADSFGIFASTFGPLNLSFSGLAAGLYVRFAVQGVTAADPSTLVALFGNGDTVIVPGQFDPLLGEISGVLDFTSSSPFDVASLLFSPAADFNSFPAGGYSPYFFSVSEVSYEPVPEPGTILLLIIGGACAALAVRARRRRALARC